MTIQVVGIDLSKSIFQVCVLQQDGSITWNRKITDQAMLVAMEACGYAHHWVDNYHQKRKLRIVNDACSWGSSR